MKKINLNTEEYTNQFAAAAIYAKKGAIKAVQITENGLKAGKYTDKDIRFDDEKGQYVIDTYVMREIPVEGKGCIRSAELEDTRPVEVGEWIATNPKVWESDRDNIAAFDPRFPEVREYLCSVYERALREWNLDGFKLDFIDTFRPSANDPAVAENYAGRDIKSVTEATNVLMNQVREHLQAIKPDLLIEFRQEYIGPAIRQYGNMLRAGDCPGDMAANRIRTANLRITSGHTAVHADMIEWNVDESPEVAARHILSALFSTIQYSMMLCDISPEQRAMIKHWIDFTQCHRTTLLKSSFRPYHPELCYPLIEAESADELISAVYADNTIATVASADKTVYVVNATGQGSVVVDLAAAPRRIEAFDTYGNPVKVAKPKAGVSRINVPVSGYIRLDYK